ncbi:MAG TPA: NADH-quinone oxidoreductase subunit C, partial [Dongiaceae bacterium]|nr:NADH-quinone oxidoreductase subunit C [Dongiaceae bacterium]
MTTLFATPPVVPDTTPTATPIAATVAPATDAPHADAVATRLRERLGGRLREVSIPTPGRLYVTIDRDAVVAATRLLIEDAAARYVISVGADRRQAGQGFEALHCFAFDSEHLRCVVRVPLDATRPAIDSITPIVPGASWAELEMRDMLGIECDGHPDPRPLMLPD